MLSISPRDFPEYELLELRRALDPAHVGLDNAIAALESMRKKPELPEDEDDYVPAPPEAAHALREILTSKSYEPKKATS